MGRSRAIARAEEFFTSGSFRNDLARLVEIPSESQNPDRAAELSSYLTEQMVPRLEALGFSTRLLSHPKAGAQFLYAERIEDESRPTVLGYGHGDVSLGQEELWMPGTSPWALTEIEGCWFGRGVADNKGQHLVNLEALRAVLETRGKLGFNAKFLIEMGEETGSRGLSDLCRQHKDLFSADLLIASDGPRLSASRPTLFLGARSGINFDLRVEARKGAHHSGNWGGLLSDPAIQLAHAIAVIVSPTGRIRIPEWVPTEIPEAVRRALKDCRIEPGPGDPEIDPDWGEPGLSAPEQLFGWCSFDVLAMEAGNPSGPVNAVLGTAWARCQLRFVVGIDYDQVLPALECHLARHGLEMVKVEAVRDEITPPTRLDPDDPWVKWTSDSIERTTSGKPAILPNIGGSLPNHVFADILGLRTIWIPHSFPGCSQHAPNEHLPPALLRQGLTIMAGIYWDLGEDEIPAALASAVARSPC